MGNIKGKIIAIGGAEDKGVNPERGEFQQNNLNFTELGILRRIVEEAGGTDARIEVITTASTIPFEVSNNYMNAFGKIGCTNVGVMHIQNRQEALDEDCIKRIGACDGVMFSGGNQMRLTSIFGDTEFLETIIDRYQKEKFVIAGTSAGAMAMSDTMIYEGNASRAHLKGEVKTTRGLGFMSNVIFDSHFEKRGRFGRLAQVVALNPECIGIGLGEDTGMIILQGNRMEAIGSGLVMIIDGHEISHTNISNIPSGNPLSVENLKVHFCARGNGYLIKERKFVEHINKASGAVTSEVY
jgi:cyanophycinase